MSIFLKKVRLVKKRKMNDFDSKGGREGYFMAAVMITDFRFESGEGVFQLETANGGKTGVLVNFTPGDFERSSRAAKERGAGAVVRAKVFPIGPGKYKLFQLVYSDSYRYNIPVPFKIHERAVEVAKAKSHGKQPAPAQRQHQASDQRQAPGQRQYQAPSQRRSSNVPRDVPVNTTRQPKGPPSEARQGEAKSKGFNGGNKRNGRGFGGGSFADNNAVTFEEFPQESRSGFDEPKQSPTAHARETTVANELPAWLQPERKDEPEHGPEEERKDEPEHGPEEEVCFLPVRNGDEESPLPKTLNYSTKEEQMAAPSKEEEQMAAPSKEEHSFDQAGAAAQQETVSPATLLGTRAYVNFKSEESIQFDYGGGDKLAILKPGDTVDVYNEEGVTSWKFDTMIEMLDVGQEVEANITILDGEAKISSLTVRQPQYEPSAPPTSSGDDGGGRTHGGLRKPFGVETAAIKKKQLEEGPSEVTFEAGSEAVNSTAADASVQLLEEETQAQVVPTSGEPLPDDDVITGSEAATRMEESAGEASEFNPMAADISYYEQDHTVPAAVGDCEYGGYGTETQVDANANLYEDDFIKQHPVVAIVGEFAATVEGHSKALMEATHGTASKPLDLGTIHEVDEEVAKFEEDEAAVVIQDIDAQEVQATEEVGVADNLIDFPPSPERQNLVLEAPEPVGCGNVDQLVEGETSMMPLPPALLATGTVPPEAAAGDVSEFGVERQKHLIEFTLSRLLGDVVKQQIVDSDGAIVDQILAEFAASEQNF